MRDQDSAPSLSFHPASARRALLFGPFRFDLTDKTLSRDGQEVRVPPRALLILDHLITRPGRLVTKQELLDVVWKDAFVSESSLTEAIRVLRQALGDSAPEGQYIQTVHRRGYRFVAELRSDALSSVLPPPALVPASLPEATVANVPAETFAAPRARRAPVGLVIAAAAILALVVVAAWLAARKPATPTVTRSTITLPPEQAPAPALSSQPIAALSPDGRRIIYVAGAPGGYRLFLRAIDQFEAIPVPGTDGAYAPFFSPDGASIGFFARARLLVMRLPDGEPIDLAPAGSGQGGWWHSDGSILFATGDGEGLYRIPATGGERRPVRLSGFDGATLMHPVLLDDGRTVLATAWKMNVRHSEVVAVDIETGSVRTIGRGVHPRGMPDGRVLYLRDGDLVAAPAGGQGPEIPLISGVMTGVTGAGQYSLAANGTLLYLPDAPARLLRRIVRVSDDGGEEPLLFEPRAYQNLALSPDGRRIAATVYERGASDLWVGEIERGVLQRLTSVGGTVDPVWSRDGRSIYFAWARPSGAHVYRMPADGSLAPEIVSSVRDVTPASVTRDGLLFAVSLQPGGGADILAVAPDGSAQPWLATAAAESGAQVSPDDRYVTYHSRKSGRFEAYVRPAAGGPPEQQVSINGGFRPGWSADGRAILFVESRRIHRAGFADGRLSRPVPIYGNDRMVLTRFGPATLALMAIEEERALTTLNLVVGWTDEVRNRK